MTDIREEIEWLEIEASKSQFDSPYSKCLATMERLSAENKELLEIVDHARDVMGLLNGEEVSRLFNSWNDWFEKTEKGRSD